MTLTTFKSVLEGYGIHQYVDGIDFDWEASGAAAAINNLAPAFKKAGYVVTSAPMASQLHGGCGYGRLSGGGRARVHASASADVCARASQSWGVRGSVRVRAHVRVHVRVRRTSGVPATKF